LERVEMAEAASSRRPIVEFARLKEGFPKKMGGRGAAAGDGGS
jgi:hypothetical protein